MDFVCSNLAALVFGEDSFARCATDEHNCVDQCSACQCLDHLQLAGHRLRLTLIAISASPIMFSPLMSTGDNKVQSHWGRDGDTGGHRIAMASCGSTPLDHIFPSNR
ncbi:hypothetical protein T01_467 [Trichinella spiralis]|uniref:Uncharacterized protein n=1 Tax=Trichinella spiralis TaxID=6334 RepID=A0A0V1BI09_TRISP|nr:hypothetical protein T01_467 [Trichinella spiralis]